MRTFGPPTVKFLCVLALDRFAVAIQTSLRVAQQVDDVVPERQTLGNYQDVMYMAPFTMGGQKFKGILDTGSFDFVLFAKDCQTCGTAAAYDASESPTYKRGKTSQMLAYGSGACRTHQGYDSVSVAGLASADQVFWDATECNMPLLDNAHFQAIVGVGPPGYEATMLKHELTQAHQHLMWWKVPQLKRALSKAESSANLALVDKIHVGTFSTCLGRQPGSPGYWIWNDAKPSMRAGLVTAQVAGEVTWSVKVTSASFVDEAGTETEVGCSGGCGAIVDTGTTLIGVPSAFFNNAFNHINSLGMDCSDLSVFPTFQFKVGDGVLTLPPEAYIAEVPEGSAYSQLLAGLMHTDGPSPFRRHSRMHATRGAVFCQLMLMDMGEHMTVAGPEMILGMSVFREYYTTFDLGAGVGDRTISFSPANENCDPISASEAELNGFRHNRYGIPIGAATRQPNFVNISEIRVPRVLDGRL